MSSVAAPSEAFAPAAIEPALIKALGFWDVVLYLVTAGTNLQWVATAAAAGPSSLVVWIMGGVTMFLPLSVCVVFLSSRHPDQGGLYMWSKLAFGPFMGFMTGWTYWTSNLPYFPGLLYFAAGNLLFWTGRHDAAAGASPGYFMTFALAGLTAATVLNIYGLRCARWLCNAGAVLRWVSVLLLVALGTAIGWRFGAATAIDWHSLLPPMRLTDMIFWSAIAFAWTGPESASFMGGEIRDGQRTVPRALLMAAPMIALLYLAGTLSVMLAIPRSDTDALYGVMQAISGAAPRVGLSWLVPLSAVCVSLTCLASVGAWLGSVARIPSAAGLDNFLPKSFAYVHPRYGSPVTAIIVQSVIAGVVAFLGQAGTSVQGAYQVLVSMMVVAVLIPFLALFAAAIKLAGGEPVPGETRIPGGRITVIAMGVLGLATTAGAMALAFIPSADEPHPTLAVLKVAGLTVVVLLAGGGVYLIGRRRAIPAAVAARVG